jgi:hypothetical protein
MGRFVIAAPTRWRRHWKRWGVAYTATLCLSLALFATLGQRRSSARPSQRPAGAADSTARAPILRKNPFRLRTTVSLAGGLGRSEPGRALARLRRDRPTAMAEALHGLRLFSCEAGIDAPRPSKTADFLEAILDYEKSKACFQGQPALIDTRYGVRSRIVVRRDARWQPERQAHDDQLLAVLAELGVPLDHPLSTAGGRHSVQDLLDDAIAIFDLKSLEIEWTALAFVLYLPPRTSWTDKYGGRYTFDELAEELLGRPYAASQPCGSTHLLYSLAAMLQVADQEGILTPPVHERLRSHLAAVARNLPKRQSARGSWQEGWYEETQPVRVDGRDNPESSWPEVLVTGHHLEWLMLLPPELLPPRDCFLRAARWLQVQLLAVDPQTLDEHYCPYSHAARVLLLSGAWRSEQTTAETPRPVAGTSSARGLGQP